MTPKEKAKELVDKFYSLAENIEWSTTQENKEKCEKLHSELGEEAETYWIQLAKKSALIAVDFSSQFITGDLDEAFDKALYLAEIKQEIKLL